MNASINWSVYIILCTDNMLYTGITSMSSDDSINMLPESKMLSRPATKVRV